jgi:hypothetical protein
MFQQASVGIDVLGELESKGCNRLSLHTDTRLHKVLVFFTKYHVWDSIGAGYGIQMIPLCIQTIQHGRQTTMSMNSTHNCPGRCGRRSDESSTNITTTSPQLSDHGRLCSTIFYFRHRHNLYYTGFNAFCSMISLTAAKTNQMFVVSIACVIL